MRPWWQSFQDTAAKLRAAAGNDSDKPARGCAPAGRCAEQLAAGPAARARAAEALVPGLKTMLRQLSDSLTAAARHPGQYARRDARGLDGAGRHRPHPGLSQGHQQ